jgi:CubicO group peptidase (beta-lactamase class C family)
LHPDLRLRTFLEVQAISGARCTAVAAAVVRHGRLVARAVAGSTGGVRSREVLATDLFDLASLTKPWLATLAGALDEDGSLALSTPIGEVWSDAPGHLAAKTCEDLLRHRAGLQPWAPLYVLCKDPREIWEVLGSERYAGAPADTYCDLGYLLWRLLAERALGRSIVALLTERLGPMAGDLRVAPVLQPNVVHCRLGTAREVELARALGIEAPDLGPPAPGAAQDGNARFVGGLAGHAGLFGTVDALLALGAAWIRPAATPSRAAAEHALAGSGELALGWRRNRAGGAAHAVLSPAAIGHTGFVGGGLWIDPEPGLVVAMLGHRQDPFLDLTPLRSSLLRLALELVGAA